MARPKSTTKKETVENFDIKKFFPKTFETLEKEMKKFEKYLRTANKSKS